MDAPAPAAPAAPAPPAPGALVDDGAFARHCLFTAVVVVVAVFVAMTVTGFSSSRFARRSVGKED